MNREISDQVQMLEDRIIELESRIYAAQRSVDIANRRAKDADLGVGSRASYEMSIASLRRRLVRVRAERDKARADLKLFADGPEMTATEVLLRKELACANARADKAEKWAREMAESAIYRPIVVSSPEPVGWGDLTKYGVSYRFITRAPLPYPYFWLGVDAASEGS